MYLIFIALLAMNVSKSVLNAFGLTNDTLEESNRLSKGESKMMYQNLRLKREEQPTKFEALYQKSEAVKKLSDALYNYIESMKDQLYKSYGFERDSREFENMDQSDALDDMLFAGGGLSKKGKEFQERVEQYREGMVALLDAEKDALLIKRIKELFDTKPITDKGLEAPWLSKRFEGFPMVASVTTLSKIQADIRSTELVVVRSSLEGELSQEVSYSNYNTILQTDKTAFFKGQNFTGNLVLGRTDNSTKPNEVALTLDGKPLGPDAYELEGGRVKLDFPVTAVGEHKLGGKLVFSENGGQINVPVNASFAVIAQPNTAVISADKMNVLYRGVNNPVSISIPGLSDDQIRVSAPGFRKVGTGKYTANVTSFKGRNLEVRISATLPDGKKINPSKTFRVKDIPAPEGTIRGQVEARMYSSSFVRSTVGASLPDFPFDLKLVVKSFIVKIPTLPSIPVSGNRMNDRVKRAINRVNVGEQVTINNIKVGVEGMPNYRVKRVSPVVITITGR